MPRHDSFTTPTVVKIVAECRGREVVWNLLILVSLQLSDPKEDSWNSKSGYLHFLPFSHIVFPPPSSERRKKRRDMESHIGLQDIPQFIEFERAVANEFSAAGGQEELILRSSTGLSALLKEIGHQYAKQYFRHILADVLDELAMRSGDGMDGIVACAHSLMARLCSSATEAPLVLRSCSQYMVDTFDQHFPDSNNGVQIVVGNFLILRIICPILVKPQMLGFHPHRPKLLAASISLAKLVHHTLTGRPVEEFHEKKQTQNLFIRHHANQMRSFLCDFPCNQERISTSRCDIDSRSMLYKSKSKRVAVKSVKEPDVPTERSKISRLFFWIK